MRLGRTLRLYLADGHPAGLIIAEILNWTGQVLSFPRGLLPQVLKTRKEISRTGIYFLVGADPDNAFRPLVYVGESDDVKERLITHDKDDDKNFFEQIVLVVSKDENLTKGHIRFLEANIIEIICQNGQVHLTNGNLGQPVSLPESDTSDMEYFLEQIQVLLPVLGLSFLQKLPQRNEVSSILKCPDGAQKESQISDSLQNSPIFELSFLNNQIKAEAYEAEGLFIVKKHSSIRNPSFAAASVGSSYRQRMNQLSQNEFLLADPDAPEIFVLLKDVGFKSPSGASEFVCGASTNGRVYWKVKGTNQTYAEWRAEQFPEADSSHIQTEKMLS